MPPKRTTPNDSVVLTQEQYADLIARLENLSKGVGDIKLDLASRKHIDEEVKTHKELLAGNGKWGFTKLRDWAMAVDEDNKYFRRFAMTMAATNFISLAVAAFFWFVKVLPVIEQIQNGGF